MLDLRFLPLCVGRLHFFTGRLAGKDAFATLTLGTSTSFLGILGIIILKSYKVGKAGISGSCISSHSDFAFNFGNESCIVSLLPSTFSQFSSFKDKLNSFIGVIFKGSIVGSCIVCSTSL